MRHGAALGGWLALRVAEKRLSGEERGGEGGGTNNLGPEKEKRRRDGLGSRRLNMADTALVDARSRCRPFVRSSSRHHRLSARPRLFAVRCRGPVNSKLNTIYIPAVFFLFAQRKHHGILTESNQRVISRNMRDRRPLINLASIASEAFEQGAPAPSTQPCFRQQLSGM